MRLRSGNTTTTNNDFFIGLTNEESPQTRAFCVNNIMKRYSDILGEVHNENLEGSNTIYWEEMARVLTESYYILNHEFNTLYYFDKPHAEYLEALEIHACRSLQMIYHVMTTEEITRSTKHVLTLCMDEMSTFVENVRLHKNHM